MKKREPLAIIGIGCRYPGDANTPEEFWRLIIGKKDALGPIPADRWDNDGLYAPEWRRAGKISVNRGGFIKDIDKFDAGFFGISPLEVVVCGSFVDQVTSAITSIELKNNTHVLRSFLFTSCDTLLSNSLIRVLPERQLRFGAYFLS